MDSASKKHLYIYIYIKTICEEKSTVWKNLEYTFQKLKIHLKILVNKTLLLKVFQIVTLPNTFSSAFSSVFTQSIFN